MIRATALLAAGWLAAGLLLAAPILTPAQPAPAAPPARAEEYAARRPKTVLDLQQFRETSSLEIRDQENGRSGRATLVNLNPLVNVWYLLRLDWDGAGGPDYYHLENRWPDGQTLLLEPRDPQGLVLGLGRRRCPCDLLWAGPDSPLARARATGLAFAPLVEERLYLRNPVRGHKTSKEWTTDFLRHYVPGGESITNFVKTAFFQDAFLSESELIAARTPGDTGGAVRPSARPRPLPALVAPEAAGRLLAPAHLALPLEPEQPDGLAVGEWFPVRAVPGAYASVIRPDLSAPEVIAVQAGSVSGLDAIESRALVYLVAFDLAEFDLGFAIGTDHPEVGWSDRIPAAARDLSLPGPDGIGSIAPMVATGKVNPDQAGRVAATFVGGFRRYHGAFRRGELATRNHGSHYGFVENGVVLSKLQPGLATVVVWVNGLVELLTWTEADDARLGSVRHARQNGVPIIDRDRATGRSGVHEFVDSWANGNWSGSVDGKFRTVRAGLGIQETPESRFLIYAYFSSAAPSAMARVFEAYRCGYAMLGDMNALEHTYLSVHWREDNAWRVEHLVRGMEVLDKEGGGQVVPRFIGYADNRDFYYLLRKDP